MSAPLAVTATLTDDKVHFQASTRDLPTVEIDYPSPVGTGDGYMPLELFLMSLASCSASTISVLLRRMQRMILSMRVEATGARRNEHPTSFESIELTYEVRSPDATPDDVGKAIALSREMYCPVFVMVRETVAVTTRFRIVTA